jgi:hypothetical protein
MARNDDWGVRLADVRLPTYWWASVAVALITVRILDRRDAKKLGVVAEELGTYYGNRDRDAAAREDQLLRLNKVLLWVSVAAVFVAALSIVVTFAR